MARHILCLQIPSFQVAVARSLDSSLRQRPVVVAPTHTTRAVIREISQEAFHEGLRPGMAVESAQLLCPGLRVVAPDSAQTQEAHRELERRVHPFVPLWESIRLGSLFLDCTGTTKLLGPSIDVASRIGRELIDRQGWSSVIGLAGNKLVSQLAAATLKRPPQILWVQPGSEQPFLAPLPTLLLPGLPHVQSFHVRQRLDDLNLTTLGAIASVSLDHLEAVFGTAAGLLHEWARGIDPSPVRPPAAQPTIEHSLTLDPDEIDDCAVLGRLYRLLERLCTTLRQQRRVCRQLTLAIRYRDQTDRTVQALLPQSSCWEVDLQPALTRLFFRCFQRRIRLTRLTLRVGRLAPLAEQLSLFDNPEPAVLPRPHRLSLALDAIRAKFGEQALSWGNTLSP